MGSTDHKTPSDKNPPEKPVEKRPVEKLPVAKPVAVKPAEKLVAKPVAELPASGATTPDSGEKQSAGKVFARKAVVSDEVEQEEAESSESKHSRTAHKAPCSQCGALTRIKTLEKNGELCNRCYSPVAYHLIRVAVVLGIIAAIAGGIIAWKMLSKPVDVEATGPDTTQNEKGLSSEQKIDILRRHLLDGVPIAEVCKTFGVEENEYRQWEQAFFQAGEQAFTSTNPRQSSNVEQRFLTLETKIQMASKTLGELRDTVTQLRKELGRYEGTPAQKFILDSSGTPPRGKKSGQ